VPGLRLDFACRESPREGRDTPGDSKNRSAGILAKHSFRLMLANVSDSGHNRTVKPIDFHPRALEFIRMQTASIRRQIGEALRDLQKGVVRELRVGDETATVRVFYATGKIGTTMVFHAFQKKSQKTPMREIDLARRRLREVLDAKIEF
jgi:phage-related protein